MSYGADTPALDFCRKVQTWQGSAANQTGAERTWTCPRASSLC